MNLSGGFGSLSIPKPEGRIGDGPLAPKAEIKRLWVGRQVLTYPICVDEAAIQFETPPRVVRVRLPSTFLGAPQ